MYPWTLFVPLWVKGSSRHFSPENIRFSVVPTTPQNVQNHRDALNWWLPHLAAGQNHLRHSRMYQFLPPPFPKPLHPYIGLGICSSHFGASVRQPAHAGGDLGGKQQLASSGERQNGPSTFFHGAHGTGGQAGRALSPKTVAEMTGLTARLPSEGVRRMGWAPWGPGQLPSRASLGPCF